MHTFCTLIKLLRIRSQSPRTRGVMKQKSVYSQGAVD